MVHYGSDATEAETVVAEIRKAAPTLLPRIFPRRTVRTSSPDRFAPLSATGWISSLPMPGLAGPQLWVLLAGYVLAVEHRVSWSFKAMATPVR